jgi:hypothetical protein
VFLELGGGGSNCRYGSAHMKINRNKLQTKELFKYTNGKETSNIYISVSTTIIKRTNVVNLYMDTNSLSLVGRKDHRPK